METDDLAYANLEGEDTTLALGLITDVGVFLSHSNHHTLMARATDNRGEYFTGFFLSGETDLYIGTVVENYNFFA